MNRQEIGWTEVYRRRRKTGIRRWDHSGVITMFVSNIPDGVSKAALRRIFDGYGELTDVYMATKRTPIGRILLSLDSKRSVGNRN
uniref:RRM domain-containing protein n=1 Tax=Lactuca sativa TaxID=4236 RepID=A0A9R1X975_LACSA|nr:hypothetical protein LSAT_V11C600309730 [Lactuca sativa]